jgi:hypothetical protein
MTAAWPAVIYGKRVFAWDWTPVEGRREVRWRWVVRLQPLGGILPTYNGQILTHTTAVPFSHASPIKQVIFDTKGKIMNFTRTHRAIITLALWLVAVECITIVVSFVFGYPAEFGGFHLGLPMPVYIPGAFVTWGSLIEPRYQWMVTAAMIASVVVGVGLLLRLLFDVSRNRGVQDVRPGIYGQREQAQKDHLL